MAEPAATPPQPPTGPGPTALPPLMVQAQYIKDLSFENPRAPQSFAEVRTAPPAVDINVDVGARAVQERTFEVVLALRAEAKGASGSLFVAELHYAGLFTLGEVPQEAIEPLLLIQAPHLLFPFARAIIADAVRDGGFPALLTQPVDFAGLYRQRRQREAAAAAPPTNCSGAPPKAS